MMVKAGPRKVVKKEVDKTQYCIDGVLINEVLNSLPEKGIDIIGASILINHYSSRERLPIPNKLKKLGTTLLSERKLDVRAAMVFDQTTPAIIKRNVSLVCKELGTDINQASFLYLTIQNGTSSGKFYRTKKDIVPSDNDLRRKTNVLGLVDAKGDVKSLIRAVSADAYVCNIQTVETRIMLCNKQ